MFEIGRGLILREQPEAAACLIRYILTRPVVLAFRYIDNVPVLTARTGRGLTGWISIRRAIKAFNEELPEGVKASDKAAPKNSGDTEKEKKKKKKTKDRDKEDSKEGTEE